MKRRLATTFSHELRTPLTAIYGFVSLLQEDLEDLSDEQVREMLGHIELGTQRLSRLTEDLLLLLQIDSGTVAIEIGRFSQPVDLREVVDEAIQPLGVKAQQHQTKLEIEITETLLVEGIPLYLANALMRLIDNAIKFSPREGGHVLIAGSRQNDIVRVVVKDKGAGIPPDKQQQLFQSFGQIDRERMEQQGTGLGLVIAMNLAKLHGGTIEVESQENVGSTFTLILPAMPN
jgi:two-component system phosphate regulon sensor histidine kinase PhoR